MLPFRRILFPVDYSEPCLAVVPYIKDLIHQTREAGHPQPELTLVHAYGAEALAYSDLPLTDPSLAPATHAAQEDRIRRFGEQMFPLLPATCFAALGEPGAAVHELVERESADLVMLPTHGRGTVRRFLLGSVTAKVLHDVGAAVWTGTGSAIAGHVPNLPYKTILCAVDETAEAECVLRAASALAKMYQASLSLVRVVEPMPATEFDMLPYQQDRIEAAHFNLRELAGSLQVDAPRSVIESGVADGVTREATRIKADLVITGRGHSQGLFTTLRSHLYQIVRESPCPVLSI